MPVNVVFFRVRGCRHCHWRADIVRGRCRGHRRAAASPGHFHLDQRPTAPYCEDRFHTTGCPSRPARSRERGGPAGGSARVVTASGVGGMIQTVSDDPSFEFNILRVDTAGGSTSASRAPARSARPGKPRASRAPVRS